MKTESTGQVHRWRAFAVPAVSFFIAIADLAIVNVALPTIGRDLDTRRGCRPGLKTRRTRSPRTRA